MAYWNEYAEFYPASARAASFWPQPAEFLPSSNAPTSNGGASTSTELLATVHPSSQLDLLSEQPFSDIFSALKMLESDCNSELVCCNVINCTGHKQEGIRQSGSTSEFLFKAAFESSKPNEYGTMTGKVPSKKPKRNQNQKVVVPKMRRQAKKKVKGRKGRFSKSEVKILEQAFNEDPWAATSGSKLKFLKDNLPDMTPKQIKTWFATRRFRPRRHNHIKVEQIAADGVKSEKSEPTK